MPASGENSEAATGPSATTTAYRGVAGESNVWLDRLTARFRAAILFQVPVGYEDEDGFHHAAEDAQQKESTSPEPDDGSTHTTES